MEKRVLIAFVLSAVIFAVWSVLFPPPKHQPKPVPEAARPSPESNVEADPDQVLHTIPETDSERLDPPPSKVTEAAEEQSLTIENDVVSVVFSNRGAAITSLILLGYEGDDKTPLDIVQDVENVRRTLPLQFMIDERPDQNLYEVEQFGQSVVFLWADGFGNSIEKKITIPDRGYGLEVGVRTTGSMKQAEMSIGTGMRNTGIAERKNRFSTWGDVVVKQGDESEEFKREKLDNTEIVEWTEFDLAGFSDTYFVNLFIGDEGIDRIIVEPLTFDEVNEEGETEVLPVLQVRLASREGRFEGRLFAAPKQFDLLQAEGNGLEEMLDFGIFHPISVFFLKALRWIHTWVGNWGWSIVLLTLGIRIVLFPLMHVSTVSMRRMQKMQPRVKAIQEKYKKNKSDPQIRAKMNQETMALYKEEGVNPMGGCLPMLVQLPILWALYTLFAHAIELRHAPFMMWIVDLSAKDPLLITPVLMTGTMWLQQRLAPQAGDPQQQKIFRMMPLIFGIMFLGFPAGLVLYWLSNNVITIFQQELTLRLIGERGGKNSGSKRKDKKK